MKKHTPQFHYWAVRPKTYHDAVRIERATSALQAYRSAFGSHWGPLPDDKGRARWEAKDLGTRVSVVQSDNKRIKLLGDPTGWTDLIGPASVLDAASKVVKS